MQSRPDQDYGAVGQADTDEDFTDGIEYGFPICCVIASALGEARLMPVKPSTTASRRTTATHSCPAIVWHFPDIPLWKQEILDGDT